MHTNEKTGKRPLVFKETEGAPLSRLDIPCGQCIGCRLERSRQWAIRCVHEASLHDDNAFITLTYNNENLPDNGGLVKKDFQTFMKRLRKSLSPIKIKFFMCGEYGQDDNQPTGLGRPHFHACIFGYSFPDRQLYAVRDEVRLYVSEELQRCWKKGFSTVGDVTFESAAYVARYVMKKITGDDAEDHYRKIDKSGSLSKVIPEYVTMSRGGREGRGIAYDWWSEFKKDTEKDFITVRGVKMKPPKYYDNLFSAEAEEVFEKIKKARIIRANMHKEDQTWDRLRVREQVKKNRIKSLKRDIDL